jgi:CMP-N-acetylneuraminic acid synthetase
MSIAALICARGGSKGLPGKNIKPLAGKPLISWAIASALSVPRVTRTIVSTDSLEIADAARAAGAEVPFMRPSELANDDSPEWAVWRHALTWMKGQTGTYPDGLLVVPATAPLRAREDLDRCLDAFGDGDVDVVITVTEAHRSPYFNMVRANPDGTVSLVIPSTAAIARRQDAPAVFDITTVAYVARPEFVMSESGMFQGRVRAVSVPVERAIDIDTPLDFDIAEWLMAKKNS